MTLSLQQYAEKHNYEIIEEYTTYGGEAGGNYQRAIVKDKTTGECFRLYFDRTKYKRHRTNIDDPFLLGHYWYDSCFTQRGWRNTTLDNRRTIARNTEKFLAANPDISAADLGLE